MFFIITSQTLTVVTIYTKITTMNLTVNTTSFFDANASASNQGTPTGFARPEPGVYTDVKEWIWKIVPPIVIILGTFGNSLTILVLLRQIRNLSSTAVYLLTLAFSDLLVLYLGPLRQWISYLWKIDVRTLTNVGCKIQIFLTYFGAQFSSWLLVAVTIERAVSVIFPHKVKLACTTMKAGVTVLTIFVCIFGLNAHFFYGYGQTYVPMASGSRYRCVPIYDNYKNFRDDILPWIDFSVTFLVPFVLLSTSNILIIFKLKRNTQRRKKMSISRNEKEGRSVTIMLIVLCVVFFICLTPVSIYLILQPYIKENARKLPFEAMIRQLEYQLFWHALTNCFSYINACTNFIFYFLSGSRFRAEVRALFTCKKAGKEGVFGNSSSGRSTSISNISSQNRNHPGSRTNPCLTDGQRENDQDKGSILNKPKTSSNDEMECAYIPIKNKESFTNLEHIGSDNCEINQIEKKA